MLPTALARRCGATLAGQLQLELQLSARTARQRNKYLPRSARVRRQGLEPRTRGLRVGCLAAPGVLPARIPQIDAQKAHIAQEYGWRSSHESSHGSQAELGGDPSQ